MVGYRACVPHQKLIRQWGFASKVVDYSGVKTNFNAC